MKVSLDDLQYSIPFGNERPDIEQKKHKLMGASNTRRIEKVRRSNLRLITDSTNAIVEDEVLINMLTVSKLTQEDIKHRIEEAKKMEEEIKRNSTSCWQIERCNYISLLLNSRR